MTATDTSNRPDSSPSSTAPLTLGIVTFILGALALVCWFSGWFAFLGMLLDFLALPFFLSALATGAVGLVEDRDRDYAIAGIVLALIPFVLTLLFLSSAGYLR